MSPERNLERNEKGSVFVPVAMILILLAVFYYWYSVRYGSLAVQSFAMPLGYIAFGSLLCRKTYGQRREFMIVLAFFVWYVLTRVLNGDFFLESATFNTPFLCIALCVALPLSGALSRRNRAFFEIALGLLIVGFFTVIALLSIYAVITNQSLQLHKATFTIGLDIAQRLEVWQKQANIMGALFSVCIFIAIFIYARLKRPLLLLLPLLGVCASLYIALGLTVSRTSMISLSVFLGLILSTLLYRNAGRLKKPLRIALTVVALVGVSLVLYKGFGVTNEAVSRISLKYYPRAEATVTAEAAAPAAGEAAGADASQPAVVGEERNYSDLGTLSGRTLIYAATFRAIADNPKILLIGNLDGAVMDGVNPYLPYAFAHTHNAVLQVLMTCGLVGVGLMLWFVVRLLIRIFRLYSAKSAAASDIILAVIPLVVLLHSLFEPFIFTYYDVINIIFFLYAGMVLSRSDARALPVPAPTPAAPDGSLPANG